MLESVMCKIGDIILISQIKDGTARIGAHPFLVLDDADGIVRGTYHYDFIALLLSSNTTERKREKLFRFPGNFPISADDKIITEEHYDNLDAFVEADQFFYFDKSEISYIQLGRLDSEIFDLLLEFMDELKADGVKFRQIVSNTSPIN